MYVLNKPTGGSIGRRYLKVRTIVQATKIKTIRFIWLYTSRCSLACFAGSLIIFPQLNMILSKSVIKEIFRKKGSLSKKSLARFGLSYPLKHGWKDRLIGMEIPDDIIIPSPASKKEEPAAETATIITEKEIAHKGLLFLVRSEQKGKKQSERYFCIDPLMETEQCDGTARGFGFKSLDKFYRYYWYHKKVILPTLNNKSNAEMVGFK